MQKKVLHINFFLLFTLSLAQTFLYIILYYYYFITSIHYSSSWMDKLSLVCRWYAKPGISRIYDVDNDDKKNRDMALRHLAVNKCCHKYRTKRLLNSVIYCVAVWATHRGRFFMRLFLVCRVQSERRRRRKKF